ncbi:MAG TPA: tetratricopeptide repeat protein, partial [bacterium]|nr:tetratricopeptide repeat protein [bacterium]
VRKLEEALNSGFDDGNVRWDLALAYFKSGRCDRAEKTLEDYISSFPGNGEAWHLLARICEKSGKHKKAVEGFRQALECGYDDLKIHEEMGVACMHAGAIAGAFAEFLKVLEKDPGNIEAHISLAGLHERQEEYAGALQELKSAIDSGADPGRLARDLGRIYFKKKEMKEALESLQVAVGINSEDRESRLLLGRAYVEMQAYEQAAAELRGTLSGAENDIEISLLLAEVYFQLKEYDSSLEVIRKFLEKDSGNGALHSLWGKLSLRKGEIDTALRSFETALNCGENKGIYPDLGRALLENGDYSQAVEFLSRAVNDSPDDGDLHLALGRAFSGLQQHDSAAREFEEAKKRGVPVQKLDRFIGTLFYRHWASRLGEERRDMLIAVSRTEREKLDKKIFGLKNKQEKDSQSHLEIGRLYRETGRYSLSKNEFLKALEKRDRRDAGFDNMIKNEIEISGRKTILNSRPRELRLTLTNKCNLHCRICSSGGKTRWEISESLVREIEELFPSLENIFWGAGGGEVFLSRHFERLFEKAAANPRLMHYINTNGILLDEKWAERFSRVNICLNFSIDGIKAETYESLRAGGRFNTLLDNIGIINRNKRTWKTNAARGLHTGMNFVVMKSNYREMQEALEFAIRHGFEGLRFSPIEATLDKENIFFHRDQEALQYIENILPALKRRALSGGIKLNLVLPVSGPSSLPQAAPAPGRRKCEDGRARSVNRKKVSAGRIICYRPWTTLFIGAQQNIRPHCICPVDIGDIRKAGLMQAWNSERMQKYRAKLLAGELDWCDYKCLSGLAAGELREL